MTLRPAFSTVIPAGAEESWEFISEEGSEGRGGLTSCSWETGRGKPKDERGAEPGRGSEEGKGTR